MSRRTERVSDLLRAEIAGLIQRESKDPRLAHGLVSITEVTVSPDLRNATVFVSHLGDEADRPEILSGLQHSAGWLQDRLMHRLHMKRVPALEFEFDPSIERGARLAAMIEALAVEDSHGAPRG